MVSWVFNRPALDAATLLGSDDSNNSQATTLVVGNADGSMLERNEYIQQLLAGADGVPTYPAAAAPADAVSLAEVLREIFNQQEKGVSSGAAAVLATGTTIWTVAGGPIMIKQLVSICQVGADSTAATLQWSADGTLGSATTFTAASASRANQAAGDAIVANFTALNTAPDLVANGVGLGPVLARSGIIVPAGIITTTIGSGPTTTGTYIHYMRYVPLSRGVTVV